MTAWVSQIRGGFCATTNKIYKPSKIYPPCRQHSPPCRMMCRRAPVPTNPHLSRQSRPAVLMTWNLNSHPTAPITWLTSIRKASQSDVSDTDPNIKWLLMALYFTRSTNVTNAKDFGLHFCAAKLHLHSSFNEARKSYKEAVLGGIQLRVDRLQTQRDEVVLRKGRDQGCQGTVHDDTEDHQHLPHSSPCSSPKCKYTRHTQTLSPQPMQISKSPSIVALSSPTIPVASQVNPFCDKDVWIVSPPASHF
ncbi:hypothetical protein BJV77DRAFT_1038862 [Russula vinacea]|nr:hypothetical protein BJV77DRAFT_1038862 [Russula vinacea]